PGRPARQARGLLFPAAVQPDREQLPLHLHGARAGHDERRRAALPRELEQGRQRHSFSFAIVQAAARQRLADRSRHPARAGFARHLRAAGQQRCLCDVPVGGRGPHHRLEPADEGRAARAPSRSRLPRRHARLGREREPGVREEQPRVPAAGQAARRKRAGRLLRAVGVLRHRLLLGERADGAAEAQRHDPRCRRLRADPDAGARPHRHAPGLDAGADPLRGDDRGRALRLRRRRGGRRPHREHERVRSARRPEALRPRKPRRRAVARGALNGGSMNAAATHTYPALHNAMWPGLVGKGPDSEPPIDLDTMLDLTACASVGGVRFDGVDLFLFDPHVSIDATDDELQRLADRVRSRKLVIGSLVAPVWPPTGGGSAMGDAAERKQFVTQVRKACAIGRKLRDLGVRRYGVVRIDSASSPGEWAKDPEGNTRKIADTFREACEVAEGFGERLAAEGEICWGGMHSWKRNLQLLEMVDRPKTLGFQADMAHTLLFTLGYNAPEDRLLPADFNWSNPGTLDTALKTMTKALRPWTIDFHVAQNDATVKGSGSHDKTGRHCLPDDPNGKLNVAHHAGFWMRDDSGKPTRAFQHICWDGCMFPNATMMQPRTWEKVLGTMIAVRNEH